MQYLKLQAAVDFLMSYGIALLIIIIAIAVIYNVAILNTSLTPTSCTSSPGFACEDFALNTTGVVTLQLAQATGGPIFIHGIACSSNANAIGNKPAYGNIYVTSSSSFYPTGSYATNSVNLQSGVKMSSGTTLEIQTYCYAGGGIASGNLGNGFVGHIWINYTIQGYNALIAKVISLSAKYS